MHNPYMPPGAPVDELSENVTRKRPVAVVIAVALLGLYAALGLFGVLRFLPLYLEARAGSLIPLSFQASKWLLVSLVCFQLWRGRNWARILLLTLTVLAALSVAFQVWAMGDLPAGVKYAIDPLGVVTALLPPLVHGLAALLVFVPGRAWFAPRPLTNYQGR